MNYHWSEFTTLQFEQYAAHYVKMNFIAANCAIYEDAGGSRGVDLFMDEHEPIFYLIPSIVWRTPDELFTDSADYSRNKPAWGINISKNTIPTLAQKYWFDNIMLNRK